MKRHTYWILALGLLLVLLLAACAPAAPGLAPTPAPKPITKAAEQPPAAQATPAAKPKLEKVKLGAIPSLGLADYYIASEKGYFEQEGIEVEYVNFASGAETIPAVATGQVDVVGSLALNEGFFNALKQGVSMKMVATQSIFTDDMAHDAFVVRKDLADSGKWKGWPSLKGMTFNLMLKGGSITTVVMDLVMKKYGLTLSDFNVVYLPHDQQVVAFANKALDAGIIIEPNLTPALDQGLVVMIGRFSEVVPEAYLGGIALYSPGFAEKRTEVAKNFMVAKLRGARDYMDAFGPKRKNTDEIIRILTKYTPVKDPQLFYKMMANKTIPGLMADGTIAADQVQLYHDSFLKDGFLKEKVDFQKALDTQFADYAISKLGKYK